MKNKFVIVFSILVIFCFCNVVYSQEKSSLNQDNQNSQPVKPDVPLKIIKTYRAKSDDRCVRVENGGKAVLKVTFHETGKVTKAEIIKSSSCSYYDENAIKAALKTKFRPAMKDGKPMTVVKVLEFVWFSY